MSIREELQVVLNQSKGAEQAELLERLVSFVEKEKVDYHISKFGDVKSGDLLIVKSKDTSLFTERFVEIVTLQLRRMFDSVVILFMADEEDLSVASEAQKDKLSTVLGPSAKVKQALEAAQHELVILNGLVATDKPGAKMGKFSFRVNVEATLKKIEEVLPPGPSTTVIEPSNG